MKVSINVPDSLADITVGQYQKWHKTINEVSWTPIRQKLITVSIMCGASIEDVERMSIKDLNKVHSMVSEVLNTGFKDELQRLINIDGVEYGFHPDVSEMTTGEWADLEEELRENGDFWAAMPNILAILYRPTVKRKWWKFWDKGYKIEEYTAKHMENAEKMKKVTMDTASSMAVFFWTLGIESMKSSIQSIKESQSQIQAV